MRLNEKNHTSTSKIVGVFFICVILKNSEKNKTKYFYISYFLSEIFSCVRLKMDCNRTHFIIEFCRSSLRCIFNKAGKDPL